MRSKISFRSLQRAVAGLLFTVALGQAAHAQYFGDPNEFDLGGFPPEPTTFDEQRVMEEIRAVQSPRRTPSASEKAGAHEMLGKYYEKKGDRQRAAMELAKARYWYQGGQARPSAGQAPAYAAPASPGYSGGSAYPAAPPNPSSGGYPQTYEYPGAPSSSYPTAPTPYPNSVPGGYPPPQPAVNPAYSYPPPDAAGAYPPNYPASGATGYAPNNASNYPTAAPVTATPAEAQPKKKKSSDVLRDIAELLKGPSE